MPIGHYNVQPTGIVHVEECDSPADIWRSEFSDARDLANIRESWRSKAMVQLKRLATKRRHQKIQPTIMIEVSPVHTHGTLNQPCIAQGNPLNHSHFFKLAGASVVVKEVCPRIISNI